MILDTKDISYHSDVLKAEDFKTTFCDKWDQISKGLTLLQSALRNPVAKFIIGLVIDVGKATHDKTCVAPVNP